jgi:hypothetical protein
MCHHNQLLTEMGGLKNFLPSMVSNCDPPNVSS